jgi:hypothetical protein
MPSAASLVPNFDIAVHIVLGLFGKHGRPTLIEMNMRGECDVVT